MWIEAIISQDDFESLAVELLPLAIHLGASDSEHYLLLSAATALSLVEGRGLRFTCNAQIRWPVLGVDVPINVHGLTVLVEPSVAEGSDSLQLGIQLERANVSWLPALVDAKIVEAVNEALHRRRADLSWNFAETLSHEFALPELVQPLRALNLKAGWGKVRVTAEAMVLVISFRASAITTSASKVIDEQEEGLRPPAADFAVAPARRRAGPPSVIERASPGTIAIASAIVLAAGYLTFRGAVRLFGARDPSRRGTW